MVDLPQGRVSGRALRALLSAVRYTPARQLVSKILRNQLGIAALLELSEQQRGAIASSWYPLRARVQHQQLDQELGLPVVSGWPLSSADLLDAYRSGKVAPVALTRRCLANARELAKQRPSVAPLLAEDEAGALAAAAESERRWAAGKPRALEGVVVAIKEEIDVKGLPTRLGSGFLPELPAAHDATAVARLREAGAVVVGQTAMTEFGLSPLGGNRNREMPRNPHDPTRLPGGSSSGSGVAVATGTVPLALGLDGGGSVRIPACLNGVFGLKPTYGRVPVVGHGMGTGSSVVHIGPLAASTHDLALFTEVTAGAHPADPASEVAPELRPGDLVHALGRGVKGLRIGIEEEEWRAAPSDVAGPAREALHALESAGAELLPVQLPLARHAAAIGYLTIGLESYTGLRQARLEHFDELGPDVQLLMLGMQTFQADDYLDAQRVRAALRAQTRDLLCDVDLLALPTTALGAPRISDDEARSGFIDPPALEAMCRYAFLANLTGLPAGTAPVGTDRDGLPVGLQLMGDAWDEAGVLAALAHLERLGAAQVRRPGVSASLL